MTIGDFVRKRKHLFWSTKNYDRLSNEAVVEGILNYGDMDDVRELTKIIGIKKMAETFRKQTSGFRTNYRPEVSNYFRLYFDKYAR